jgi:hypothetical protein
MMTWLPTLVLFVLTLVQFLRLCVALVGVADRRDVSKRFDQVRRTMDRIVDTVGGPGVRGLPMFRVVQHDDHYHVLSPDGSFVGERCHTEEDAAELAAMLNAKRDLGVN